MSSLAPVVGDGYTSGVGTLVYSLMRLDNLQFYDFADATWKGSGWATRERAIPEVIAASGIYADSLSPYDPTKFPTGSYAAWLRDTAQASVAPWAKALSCVDGDFQTPLMQLHQNALNYCRPVAGSTKTLREYVVMGSAAAGAKLDQSTSPTTALYVPDGAGGFVQVGTATKAANVRTVAWAVP